MWIFIYVKMKTMWFTAFVIHVLFIISQLLRTLFITGQNFELINYSFVILYNMM